MLIHAGKPLFTWLKTTCPFYKPVFELFSAFCMFSCCLSVFSCFYLSILWKKYLENVFSSSLNEIAQNTTAQFAIRQFGKLTIKRLQKSPISLKLSETTFSGVFFHRRKSWKHEEPDKQHRNVQNTGSNSKTSWENSRIVLSHVNSGFPVWISIVASFFFTQ